MKHILAIDDNPANLTLVRESLQELYKVSVVTSGKQALSFLGKKEVDLILLDVLMPEMNGIETLSKINNIPNKHYTVIMMTALNDNETINQCTELGAKGYIEKPFRPSEIKAKVKELLDEA